MINTSTVMPGLLFGTMRMSDCLSSLARLLVLLLLCCLTAACESGYAVRYGEDQFRAIPLFDPRAEDLDTALKNDPFAFSITNDKNNANRFKTIDALAEVLKRRSNDLCEKFKVDSALSQTGTNWVLDAFSAAIAPAGAIVGGVTGQAVSATQGATAALKKASLTDIYQGINGVLSNYIDINRDKLWLTIDQKLKSDAYGDEVIHPPDEKHQFSAGESQLVNDVQDYHNRCSLLEAIRAGQNDSSQMKKKTDEQVQQASATPKITAEKPVMPKAGTTVQPAH